MKKRILSLFTILVILMNIVPFNIYADNSYDNINTEDNNTQKKLEWLNYLEENNISIRNNKHYTFEAKANFHINGYRVIRINCPIDATVYNSKDLIVAQIINDEKQEFKYSSIEAGVNSNGEKIFYLPADGAYTIELKATDDGMMNYSVNEYSMDINEYVKITNFNNIKIKKGDILRAEVPKYPQEDREYTGDGSSVIYKLFDKNGAEIAPNKSLKGEEARNSVYEVNIEIDNPKGGNIIRGRGLYPEGSFAMPVAYVFENCEFGGWYEDGKLVSTEQIYRFMVERDVNLTAKFIGDRDTTVYTLNIKANNGGEITTGRSGSYQKDYIIPISANPHEGYKFKNWVSSNGGIFENENNNTTNFKMPENDTTITANFEKLSNMNNSNNTQNNKSGSGNSNIQDSFIDIKNATFDKSYPKDINVLLTKNNNILYNIKNGNSILKENVDYTVDRDTVSIKSSYLHKINENNIELVFEMSNGENPKLSIKIIPKKHTSSNDYEDIENPFEDISKDKWYYYYVIYAYKYGLLSGTSSKKFSPNMPMTRAMFIQAIANIQGLYDNDVYNLEIFNDVPKDKWYTRSINWAFMGDLILGKKGDNFYPNKPITREETAVILKRFSDSINLDFSYNKSEAHKPFSDENDISDYAKDSVNILKEKGIIVGKGNNMFKPKESLTRAETTTILYKYIVYVFNN